MAYRVYLVVVLTIIAIHVYTSEARECNEAESCINSNDCPRYIRYQALTGKEKKQEARRLKSQVCNRELKQICCKDTTTSEAKCNEGETCMDKNDCPRFKRYKTLAGAERREEREVNL